MKRKILFHVLMGCLLPSATVHAQNRMTIDELFSLVETGSKSLQSNKLSIETATKSIEAAKSQRLPEIGASLSVSYNGNVLMTDRDFSNAKGFSQPHLGNSFALEAQQAIYTGGALSAGIKLAELQKQQAQTQVEQTRNDMRILALGQYLDLYKMDNSVKVYKQNIALTEKLIADIKAKQSEGMALKNDVTRYELQLETLRLGLRKIQDQQKIASHQLCHTLGINEQTILPDTTLISKTYGREGEQAWQDKATISSPIIKQSIIGTQLAEQQLRLAKSETRPKVGIFAVDNFNGPFIYDIPPIDKNINVWSIGIGVKYSLSSLYKSNKNIRRSEVLLRQSKENQAVAAEQVDNQVQQAHTLYEQAYVNLETQQKSTLLARQNYQVVNDRYLNQLALVTDMIDASNIKINAELQEVDARINIVYAYYKMKYLAGEI